MTKATYPEYRHLSGPTLQCAVTDVLIVVAASAWPVFAILSGGSDVVVPLLLGPGWTSASAILAILAWAYGLSITHVALSGLLEQQGRFRAIVASQGIAIAVLTVGAGTMAALEDVRVAAYTTFALYATLHAGQLVAAHKARLIDARRLGRGYLQMAIVAASSWVLVRASTTIAFNVGGLRLALLALITAAIAIFAMLWLLRGRHPAWTVARERGLVGSPAVQRGV
jgi:O-antigen/teichoic acid export membrane protein